MTTDKCSKNMLCGRTVRLTTNNCRNERHAHIMCQHNKTAAKSCAAHCHGNMLCNYKHGSYEACVLQLQVQDRAMEQIEILTC